MTDRSEIDNDLNARAERLARIAQHNMAPTELDLHEMTAQFLKTIEKLIASGLSADAAYQKVFERLTLGVDDG